MKMDCQRPMYIPFMCVTYALYAHRACSAVCAAFTCLALCNACACRVIAETPHLRCGLWGVPVLDYYMSQTAI